VALDASRHLIASIPTPAMPVWSPDVSSIAYLWDDGAGWELWTVAIGAVPRRLATGAALAQIDWSSRGDAIAFTQRIDGGTAIAVCDPESGAVRRLTDGPRDRSPQFSPDGTTLAYIGGGSGSNDIWTVATAGGAATRLTDRTNPLDEPRWNPRWSPDGRWISYVSSRSGERNNDDLWVVSSDGARHRQLTTGLILDTDGFWSPDGTTLAAVAVTEVENWYGDDADLWLIGLDDLRPERITRAGGLTHRRDGGTLAWSADGEFVYSLAHQSGSHEIASVRVSDGLITRATCLEGMVSDFALAWTGGSGQFAMVVARQTAPPEIAVCTVDGGLPAPLTNAGLRVEVDVSAPVRMPFRSYDGIYCDAYLYLPPDFTGSRRFPTLVQIHGGGTNSFGNGWHPIEQYLAQQGFIVFAIEYRGSSGYGRDFANLSWGDWGGGQTLDAVAAAAFLRSKPYVGRVGIYGQSFGGYLTLHAITTAPLAFDAAADMYGITNRFDYFDRSDRVGRVFVTRDYGGRGPRDAPDAYLRASTHHKLASIQTPLLVLHGAEDTRVPPIQSEEVVAALRANGIPHDYVVYPGEGHGFRRREHRVDAYERLAGWFNRYLAEGAADDPARP